MRETIKRMCHIILGMCHIVLEMLGEVEDVYVPTVDIPSPCDLVPNENIVYNKAKKQIVINRIEEPIWLTTVADTNSMDPVMDYGHTCILRGNYDIDKLKVGNVVVYWDGTRNIIHRIIAIEKDEFGRYFTLKGDNCYYNDFLRVRDNQICWLLLGVIY